MFVPLGVSQLVAGVVLFAVGWWGRRNVTSIVPASLAGAARQRRVRSLLRGAWTCYFLGALSLVCAVLLLGFVR